MSEVFRVVIEGDYRAGEAFEMLVKQTGVVKVQMEQMGQVTREVSAEASVNYEKMARGLWRVTSLFAVMDMAMMRVQVAHNILESSQDRYNRALREHGAYSRQAIQAHRELERVQNYVARSYIRASVAAGSFILRVILESGALKEASAAHIIKSIAETKAYIVSQWHNASLATKLVLLAAVTGGTFALAAALGAAAGSALLARTQVKGLEDELEGLEGATIGYGLRVRNPITFQSSIVVEEGMDIEEAIDENARQLKAEYRRRVID